MHQNLPTILNRLVACELQSLHLKWRNIKAKEEQNEKNRIACSQGKEEVIENSKGIVVENDVDSDSIASEVATCVADLDAISKMTNSQEEIDAFMSRWVVQSSTHLNFSYLIACVVFY